MAFNVVSGEQCRSSFIAFLNKGIKFLIIKNNLGNRSGIFCLSIFIFLKMKHSCHCNL